MESISDDVCPSVSLWLPPYRFLPLFLKSTCDLGCCIVRVLTGIIWHIQLEFLNWLFSESIVYKSVGIIHLLIKEMDIVGRGIQGEQEWGVVSHRSEGTV